MHSDIEIRTDANWREYLRETRDSFRVYGWVWRQLVDREIKRLVITTILGMSANSVVSTLTPLTFGIVVYGLARHDAAAIIASFVGFTVLKLVREVLHWWYARNREKFMGVIG
ncbi:MAG: hypothetical protein AAB692_01195, partial [Patescibacteria group bacterium]